MIVFAKFTAWWTWSKVFCCTNTEMSSWKEFSVATKLDPSFILWRQSTWYWCWPFITGLALAMGVSMFDILNEVSAYSHNSLVLTLSLFCHFRETSWLGLVFYWLLSISTAFLPCNYLLPLKYKTNCHVDWKSWVAVFRRIFVDSLCHIHPGFH